VAELSAEKAAAAKAEKEAEEKAKQEAEAKAKQEAGENAKQEAEAKAKQEEAAFSMDFEIDMDAGGDQSAMPQSVLEEQAKREAEAAAQVKRGAEEKAKQEAEAKAKQEAEVKAKQEAEVKAKEEAEEKAKEEAEEKAKQEAEAKAKQEAEEKAKQEAEVKAKQEANEDAETKLQRQYYAHLKFFRKADKSRNGFITREENRALYVSSGAVLADDVKRREGESDAALKVRMDKAILTEEYMEKQFHHLDIDDNGKISMDEYFNGIKNMPPVHRKNRAATRIQSLYAVLRDISRVQVLREERAQKRSVLAAVGYTLQGRSGWYRFSPGEVIYFVVTADKRWLPATQKALPHAEYNAQRRAAIKSSRLVACPGPGRCSAEGAPMPDAQGTYTLMNKRGRLSRWVVTYNEWTLVDDPWSGYSVGSTEAGWSAGKLMDGAHLLISLQPDNSGTKPLIKLSAVDMHNGDYISCDQLVDAGPVRFPLSAKDAESGEAAEYIHHLFTAMRVIRQAVIGDAKAYKHRTRKLMIFNRHEQFLRYKNYFMKVDWYRRNRITKREHDELYRGHTMSATNNKDGDIRKFVEGLFDHMDAQGNVHLQLKAKAGTTPPRPAQLVLTLEAYMAHADFKDLYEKSQEEEAAATKVKAEAAEKEQAEKALAAGPTISVVFQAGQMGIQWDQDAQMTRVASVISKSAAEIAGLAEGDVLISANQQRVPQDVTVSDFQSLVTSLQRPCSLTFSTLHRIEEEDGMFEVEEASAADQSAAPAAVATSEPPASPTKAERIEQKMVAKARETFNEMDQDDDGFITRDDLVAFYQKKGVDTSVEKNRKMLEAQFDAVDVDRNGSISFDEFASRQVAAMKKKLAEKKLVKKTMPTFKTGTDFVFAEQGKMGIRWTEGARIVCVDVAVPGGYAARLGVAAGDVLVGVNGLAVAPGISRADFQSLVRGLQRPCTLRFDITNRTATAVPDGQYEALFTQEGKMGITWGEGSIVSRVSAVSAGGSAEKLGVAAGDVLQSANTQEVAGLSVGQFQSLLAELPRPCILRFSTSFRLLPGHIDVSIRSAKMGITWSEDEQISHVSAVDADGAAAKGGVEVNDVLVSINEQYLSQGIDANQFRALLTGLRRPCTLRFRTTGRHHFEQGDAMAEINAVIRIQAIVRARIQRIEEVKAVNQQTGSALALPGTTQGKSGYYEMWVAQRNEMMVAKFNVAAGDAWTVVGGPWSHTKWCSGQRATSYAADKAEKSEEYSAVVKIQARVRSRVQRVAEVKAVCEQTGSCLALPGTTQGKSGYYEMWVAQRNETMVAKFDVKPATTEVVFAKQGKMGIRWGEGTNIATVAYVAPGSDADSLGVAAGDTLLSADGQPVGHTTIAEFQSFVKGLKRPCELSFARADMDDEWNIAGGPWSHTEWCSSQRDSSRAADAKSAEKNAALMQHVRIITRIQAMVRARIQRVQEVRAMGEQTGSALALPGTIHGTSGYYEMWNKKAKKTMVAKVAIDTQGEWAITGGPWSHAKWVNGKREECYAADAKTNQQSKQQREEHFSELKAKADREQRVRLVKTTAQDGSTCLALPGTVQGQTGYYEVWNEQTRETVVAKFSRTADGQWEKLEGPWAYAEWTAKGMAKEAMQREKDTATKQREERVAQVRKMCEKTGSCLALAGTTQGQSGYYEVWSAQKNCTVIAKFDVSDEGVWVRAGGPWLWDDWVTGQRERCAEADADLKRVQQGQETRVLFERLSRLFNAALAKGGGGDMSPPQQQAVHLAFRSGEDARTTNAPIVSTNPALFLKVCSLAGPGMVHCAEQDMAASVLGQSVRKRQEVIADGQQRVETARLSGVLPALPCSKQGNSGWYATDDEGTSVVYFAVTEDSATGAQDWSPVTGRVPLARKDFETQKRRSALADGLVGAPGFCNMQDGSPVADGEGTYTLMNKRGRLSHWDSNWALVADVLQEDSEGFELGKLANGGWATGRIIDGRYVLLQAAPAAPPRAQGMLEISATDLHTEKFIGMIMAPVGSLETTLAHLHVVGSSWSGSADKLSYEPSGAPTKAQPPKRRNADQAAGKQEESGGEEEGDEEGEE
jgi:S1-C subfamily serine protease/Ca2+-binding EF-hand superfamily protein